MQRNATRLALLVVPMILMGAAAGRAQTLPATAPTREPSWQSGLYYKLYELQRRPKKVRNLLPGVPPAAVGVVDSLLLNQADHFQGKTNSIQVEYRGEILLPKSGEYTFEADTDDGMELFIDGQFIMRDVWINGRKEANRKTIALERGWKPLHLRFYQGDGGFRVSVKWQPPGAAAIESISSDVLRYDPAGVSAAKQEMELLATTQPFAEELAYRAIFRTQGFFELPEDEGDLLIDLLEGPTFYSSSARRDMNNTLQAVHYGELPYWHQVKVLAGFLRGWYTGNMHRGAPTTRSVYTISESEKVEDYAGWNRARRSGYLHKAQINDHELSIYTPEPDSPERDRIASAIAGLPAYLQPLIKTVKVEPYGSANEFNGGGDTIWVRRGGPTSQEELDNLLSHEIGHLMMSKTDCYLAWEQAVNADLLSISHYGRLNPSEDFAEFVRLWISTEDAADQIASLRRLFPNRMKVLTEMVAELKQ